MIRFQKALWLVMGLFVAVAIFDRFPYPASFWLYTIALAGAVSITYYLFSQQKTEAIGLFGVFLIMLAFGAEDLVFYLIKGGFPDTMVHLDNHRIIGTVSGFFGFEQVTKLSLFLSVLVGTGISYLFLRRLNIRGALS